MSDFFRRPRGARPTRRVVPRLEALEERALFAVSALGTISGITYTGYQPPDTTGASGFSTVGEAVNLQLSFWDKGSHALIYNQSLTTFFNGVLGGGVLQGSDPVMTFDVFTGQYVVGMLDYSGATTSRFDLAVSNDDDPRHGWYGLRYNMNDGVGGNEFADYPKLGYNADAYVVTCNMFANGSSFNHVDLLSVDKNDFTNSYRVVVPGSHFTLNPVVNRDAAPGDPMWLVETSGSSALHLEQVSNLTSGPTFGAQRTVAVPSFSSMPRPRQPGGSMNWSFDTRLLNASQTYGQIITSHNTGGGGGAQARVYQVDVSSGTPVLAQTITIARGSGVDTYFPSADMNYNGDIGITYIQSSATENMSMYVTGQNLYDGYWTGGSYQTPVRVFAGAGSYTSSRAGDYAGITVDANDGVSFWAFNEYRGNSTWNTGVANFVVTYPASPPRTAPGHGLGFAEATPQTAVGGTAAVLDVSQPETATLLAQIAINAVQNQGFGGALAQADETSELGALARRHALVADDVFLTF